VDPVHIPLQIRVFSNESCLGVVVKLIFLYCGCYMLVKLVLVNTRTCKCNFNGRILEPAYEYCK
jgi:hypothetical protein